MTLLCIFTTMLAQLLTSEDGSNLTQSWYANSVVACQDTAYLYQRWKLKDVKPLSQGMSGLNHDLNVLDLRIKGKIFDGTAKRGQRYQLVDCEFIFVDKKGRPLAGSRRVDKDVILKVAYVTKSELKLILGSRSFGDNFEFNYYVWTD